MMQKTMSMKEMRKSGKFPLVERTTRENISAEGSNRLPPA
jgi:hypothetical protein